MPLSADAIDSLYRREARAMLTFFARRTHDPEAAVDLLGETFAQAIADARRFKGDQEAAVAWVYGIAHHRLVDWYRRGQVERRALERAGIERRALTEAEYERIEELAGLAELRGRVADELAALPGDAQVALKLRVVEEKSYDEVAAALGVSAQTARARVSRALRTLAGRLEGIPAP